MDRQLKGQSVLYTPAQNVKYSRFVYGWRQTPCSRDPIIQTTSAAMKKERRKEGNTHEMKFFDE
jgi:hypothetical protein